jgi:hypothetical protein
VFAQSGVTLAMRFAGRRATGTLRIAGCSSGTERVSATAIG